MADADGATPISELEKLEKGLHSIEKDGYGIACGSRHHLEDKEIVTKVLLHLSFSHFIIIIIITLIIVSFYYIIIFCLLI
jgi:hypothetical protein